MTQDDDFAQFAADPFTAEPGQSVSAGTLLAEVNRATGELPLSCLVTTCTVTQLGLSREWVVRVSSDRRDLDRVGARVQVQVDDELVSDEVVIGDTQWRLDRELGIYEQAAFEVPDGGTVTGLPVALDDDLTKDAVYLGPGPEAGWRRYWIVDGSKIAGDIRSPKVLADDAHTTAVVTLEIDARRILRRLVMPPVEARGQAVTHLDETGAAPIEPPDPGLVF